MHPSPRKSRFRNESGFFVWCGGDGAPWPALPAWDGAVSAADSACGQGLRTGAHLRCFPSHRCAAGPSPFTKPRAATPSEVPAHPAFPGRGIIGLQGCPCFDLCAAVIVNSGPEIENRCRDYLRFDLLAASICKSGLEIENRCTDCPCFDLFATSILKSGLEFKNHCSAIVPASRIARLQQYLPQRCRVRFQFSSLQSIAVPPA